MKAIISLGVWLLFVPLLAGCQDDTNETIAEAALSSACIDTQRKTVDVFNNEEAVVVYLEELRIYVLSGGKMSPARQLRYLSPCNLPQDFEQNNLRIVFSGELKETYEWEDIAAQPIVLTKIQAAP